MSDNRSYYRNVTPGPRFRLGMVEILIGINLVMFLPTMLGLTASTNGIRWDFFQGLFGLNINTIIPFDITRGAVWQIITAMFMHDGFWHIIANMYGLFLFGRHVEQRMGKIRFLVFYLVVGVLVNIATVIIFTGWPFLKMLWNPGVPLAALKVPMSLVGASGAVFGVILAFGTFYPDARLLLFFVIPVKTKWIVLAYTVFEVILLLGSGIFSSRVAHFAHLFGILFAFLYLVIVFKVNPIKEMFFPDKGNFNYYR